MLHRPIRRVLWTNCYFFHNSIVGLACVGATAYLWKLSQVCLLCMKKKMKKKMQRNIWLIFDIGP